MPNLVGSRLVGVAQYQRGPALPAAAGTWTAQCSPMPGTRQPGADDRAHSGADREIVVVEQRDPLQGERVIGALGVSHGDSTSIQGWTIRSPPDEATAH